MRYLLVIAFLLSGCSAASQSREMSVAPGQYRNFFEMQVEAVQADLKDNPAPQTVKDRYARCSSTWFAEFIRNDEKARLDAYARGERVLTVGEAQRIVENTWAYTPIKHEMTSADVGILRDLCPNDVATFQAYKLPK